MPAITIRKMLASDLPAAMEIKTEVGWNQAPEDWECFLELNPRGCFVAVAEDAVIGTATTILYGHTLAWIGMVLVREVFRRQGIATRLMEAALAYLEAQECRSILLDATEAGAAVYQKLGFKQEFPVERWHLVPEDWPVLEEPTQRWSPLAPDSIDSLSKWDALHFGANRLRLLQFYCHPPLIHFCMGDPERPSGYVLSRKGSGAVQVGPLVADSERTARSILSTWLQLHPHQPLIVDIPAIQKGWDQVLASLGFQRTRSLVRMLLGECVANRVSGIYCLAGFEFG